MERRLAAILAADVVGFSRLMGADEAGTLAALKAVRTSILDPAIAEHKGRVFKTTGDGVLVEFRSVVNAVACATQIQDAMHRHYSAAPPASNVQLRIGVNVGDVIVEDDDIFGDGVNLAARLEGIAPTGGVAISGMVRDQIGNRLDVRFEDMGERELKNIDRPVRVFSVSAGVTQSGDEPLPLPGKPSIAVLPFINMSTDHEQESFVDGLTEDLITDLSRHSGLFVIARNSTFAYKAKSIDARRIAADLGVRYLLEGSARRAGAKVRINVQLIDALSGSHLWAERFDRDLEDIFKVQDEATSRIVEALVGRLVPIPPRNRPSSMEAYELCVRARPLMEQSPQAALESRMLLERAIRLDPKYAEANSLLAQVCWLAWAHFGQPESPNRARAVEHARRAVQLDPNDAGCRAVLGLVLDFEFMWEESEVELRRAIALDPNNADAWAILSDISVLSGRPEGMERIGKAMRLNPHPVSWYYLVLGESQYALRDYEGAMKTLKMDETYRSNARKFLAASLAQLGKTAEAHEEAAMFILSNPHWTISHWVATQPIRVNAVREQRVFAKPGCQNDVGPQTGQPKVD